MSNTLDTIIASKRHIVEERERFIPISELYEVSKTVQAPKGFAAALLNTIAQNRPALIAELKKASPSKGIIREHFAPVELANAYAEGGATCLSVLTDEEYFQGSDVYLQEVVKHSDLPILRKDFMISPYQIAESRALGADCILLIMAALSDAQAQELEQAAHELGMDVLVESHDRTELERALKHLKSPLMGINNRNLKTLEVNLQTSIDLCSIIPDDKIIICESGIASNADVQQMRAHNMHTFLVGESLMRHDNVAKATHALLGTTTC